MDVYPWVRRGQVVSGEYYVKGKTCKKSAVHCAPELVGVPQFAGDVMINFSRPRTACLKDVRPKCWLSQAAGRHGAV